MKEAIFNMFAFAGVVIGGTTTMVTVSVLPISNLAGFLTILAGGFAGWLVAIGVFFYLDNKRTIAEI